MNMFRWGYIFLRTDTRINLTDRLFLVNTAANMYFDDTGTFHFEMENFEGVLTTTGKYSTIGTFGGQEFYAEIDHNKHGKLNLSFLVSEQTAGFGRTSPPNPTIN